jgi:hypothetical chaperone protein
MYCAIDFGTSNSGIAVPVSDGAGTAVRLLELEPGRPTMPTAVFYAVEGMAAHEPPRRVYGSAAIAAYVEGTEGRLMRSMKSVLGSTLVDRRTDLGAGHTVAYLDVVAGYLRHLKQRAEARVGAPIEQAVLGRPVFFVDDDAARDAQAQAALESAARAATTSSPTTACTRPAPTSTATSSSRASCPHVATRASGRPGADNARAKCRARS